MLKQGITGHMLGLPGVLIRSGGCRTALESFIATALPGTSGLAWTGSLQRYESGKPIESRKVLSRVGTDRALVPE